MSNHTVARVRQCRVCGDPVVTKRLILGDGRSGGETDARCVDRKACAERRRAGIARLVNLS